MPGVVPLVRPASRFSFKRPPCPRPLTFPRCSSLSHAMLLLLILESFPQGFAVSRCTLRSITRLRAEVSASREPGGDVRLRDASAAEHPVKRHVAAGADAPAPQRKVQSELRSIMTAFSGVCRLRCKTGLRVKTRAFVCLAAIPCCVPESSLRFAATSLRRDPRIAAGP